MELGLRDKVVLITGASGGIGRALCDVFAEEGAKLVLQGRDRFDELVARVESKPWRDRAVCARADTAVASEIEAVVEAGLARFGRIDACVANAGMWPREALLVHRASEQRIRHALDANLVGSIWTARAFFRALERTGPRADGHGASICFVGSTAGRFGERHHAEYAAAKAGLVGLMLSLKNEIVELDPHGRANVVEPGWTVTADLRPELMQPGVIARVVRTMPLRQLGRAQDVARAIAFLASPLASRHVSGQVLTIAGGMEGRTIWEIDEVDEATIARRVNEPS